VEEILKREIAKIAEEAWDSRIGGDVLEDLASRRKDPYTVADELLSKFISR